jgi:hypothetical protein
MNLPIKKDQDTGEFYIDIADLATLFENTEDIEYYTFEELDDKAVSLEFFDKNNKKVILKQK